MEKCYTLDISSIWHEEWPQNISKPVYSLFHGSVILPNTVFTLSIRTPQLLTIVAQKYEQEQFTAQGCV